jgi:hypothetical protein
MPSTEAEFIDPHEQNADTPRASSEAVEAVGNKAVETALTPSEPHSPPLEEGEPAESVTVTPPEKPAPVEAPKERVEEPESKVARTAEEKRLDDRHVKLHDKWEKAFYEKREEEQRQFDIIHARASELLPDDNSREALGHTADILKWTFWAEYGDPLPAGLKVETHERENVSKLALNEELVSPDIFNEGKYLLNECGMRDLRDQIKEERSEKYATVVPEVAEAINELPLAQAITTVASAANHEDEEGPLSSSRQIVERSKLQGRIVHETRGESKHPPDRTDIGHSRYKTGEFEIEMATEPQPDKASKNDARWARVKAFIHDAAEKHENDINKDSPLEDTAGLASSYFRRELATTKDLDDVSLMYTTGYGMLRHLLQADTREDFDTAFTAAREVAAEGSLKEGRYGMLNRYHEADEYTSGLERQFWLHQPKTTYQTESSPTYDITAAEDAIRDTADNRPRWEVNRDLPGRIGEVLQNPAAISGRIVRYVVGETADLAYTDKPTDASIVMIDKKTDRILDIPGMELLGKVQITPYEDAYYFAPNPNEDPYAPCLVPLPIAPLSDLIETYRTIGLHDLANDLQGLTGPTVFDLQCLLSTYTTSPETMYNMSYSVNNLLDCRHFVEDNKLEAKCGGSVTFLRLSIEELFENASMSPVRGYLIGGHIISRTGHRQLGVVLDGGLYYLDSAAVSPASIALQRNSSQSAPRVEGVPKLRPARQREKKVPRPFDPIGHHRVFQESLARAYGHTKLDPERLNQTIARVAKTDPTFLTYNLSHRAAKYGLSDEIKDEMRRLRKFIGNMQIAQAKKDTTALSGVLRPYLKPETSSLLQALDTHLAQYID